MAWEDFEGLMSRLDYLHSLGYRCDLALTFSAEPKSGQRVRHLRLLRRRPTHGSSDDFVEFMHEARQRGIRVIMDLVVNHTSDRHRWFKAARRDQSSRYRSWYVWSRKRPSDGTREMVFPGVQKSPWTRDRESGEYYFHRFYDFQPDLNLNMDNPEGRSEIRRIMGYWLGLGVSGNGRPIGKEAFLCRSTHPPQFRREA